MAAELPKYCRKYPKRFCFQLRSSSWFLFWILAAKKIIERYEKRNWRRATKVKIVCVYFCVHVRPVLLNFDDERRRLRIISIPLWLFCGIIFAVPFCSYRRLLFGQSYISWLGRTAISVCKNPLEMRIVHVNMPCWPTSFRAKLSTLTDVISIAYARACYDFDT